MQTMQQSTMKKLSPVIMVDAIEPCVPFWERLGFLILAKDNVEVMYQTHESVQKDAGGLVPRAHGHGAGFFIEVSDIESVVRALEGVDVVVPRRQTFYGMDEIGVREPGGHVVMFAQPAG